MHKDTKKMEYINNFLKIIHFSVFCHACCACTGLLAKGEKKTGTGSGFSSLVKKKLKGQ